tara:strand:- start:14 stop:433 length:420 start_codon:yes stop_codon:yes gene_type:complete
VQEASVWLHGQERIYLAKDFDVKVKAEEFNLKNDMRYRLICGCCSSPLTFISTKDGLKYFRHPRRSNDELKALDEQCEKRSKTLKIDQIKKYNRILEQTTIHDINSNFKNIIGKLLRLDENEKYLIESILNLEICNEIS